MSSKIETLFDLAEETAEFVNVGIEFLKPEDWEGETIRGVFLGCVHLPPAASRLDLGAFDVALFATSKGLKADVLRTTTRFLPMVKPMQLCKLYNDGRRGRTWDIRVHVDRSDNTEFALEVLRELNVQFDGSAAAFFGGDPPKDEQQLKTWFAPVDLRGMPSRNSDDAADLIIDAAMAQAAGSPK